MTDKNINLHDFLTEDDRDDMELPGVDNLEELLEKQSPSATVITNAAGDEGNAEEDAFLLPDIFEEDDEQGHGDGGIIDPHDDFRTLEVDDNNADEHTDDDEDLESLEEESLERQLASIGDDTAFEDFDEDEDMLKVFNLDDIIAKGIDLEASDIHIIPGRKIAYRILGNIHHVGTWGEIPNEVTQRIQQNITTNVMDKDFVENLELDASYVVRSGKHRGRRLRVSVGKTFGDVYMVMRIISDDIKTPEELGVHPKIVEWANLPSGLIMVNGPTGTGKSTTLASIIRKIQLERAVNIITIEKPVEYMYPTDGKAMVVQREVGRDSRTFSGALDSAMRQDPDILLIGEVRNTLEINQLLRAAETGHLALSTMHTNSAPQTINRIKSLFEGNEQIRVLSTLSDITRGFANQTLVPTADGKSRVGVQEVLEVNKEVAEMILTGNTKAMREYQEERGITMEHALAEKVREGIITLEEAHKKAPYPLYFTDLMKQKS